jgi:hypothetical protein
MEIDERGYSKAKDPETGKPLPEDNWVWSPQGLINMHYPEMWGFVQFSEIIAGTGTTQLVPTPDDSARWVLRRLYYRQKRWFAEHGEYATDPAALGVSAEELSSHWRWPPATLTQTDGTPLHISHDGRIW